LLTYLPLGMLIADLKENKPLYGTVERPRGPGLFIHHEYIVGYLHNVCHKGPGSAASVVHGPPLCVRGRPGI
jgi:hypothetical protein